MHDSEDASYADDAATYLSAKDVILAFTLRGEDGLNALPLERKAHLVRKAIAICRTEGNEAVASALVDFANKRGIIVWPGRGRNVPTEGSTRSYKAQQLKSGDPFVRVSVSALGVAKGQAVTVKFGAGVIELRARG